MKNYFRKKKINYCYGFMTRDFQVICGQWLAKISGRQPQLKPPYIVIHDVFSRVLRFLDR